MSQWIVAPIVLPALCGALMLMLGTRHGLRRTLAFLSSAAQVALAAAFVGVAAGGRIGVYRVGDWPAPYGIVLVLDRLAAFMLALTAVVGFAALVHAARGADRQGRHFHGLYQFQLMGLNGAFLAGDLFNLFVFFEVLLVASYGLLLHGSGAPRLRAGLHYVTINLAASALFLVGIALLYGVTGTLNMADLAERVSALAPSELPLAQSAALLLLLVFAVKAAVFPLYFWLPETYVAACTPVAALFVILTKVGVYAIVRVHGVIFAAGAGGSAPLAGPWLLGGALFTIVFGALGALAARRLGMLLAYLTVVSMGTILTAVSVFSTASIAAALYYLAHSTLVIAALFMLSDAIAAQRGASGDLLRPSESVLQPKRLGILFALGATAVAGLPPLAGFIGKIMILQSTGGVPRMALVWSVILGSTLLAIIALARAGSIVFWKTVPLDTVTAGAPLARTAAFAPMLLLLACSVALVVFASPIKRYADEAATQLAAREVYTDAVLGGNIPTARPLRTGDGP